MPAIPSSGLVARSLATITHHTPAAEDKLAWVSVTRDMTPVEIEESHRVLGGLADVLEANGEGLPLCAAEPSIAWLPQLIASGEFERRVPGGTSALEMAAMDSEFEFTDLVHQGMTPENARSFIKTKGDSAASLARVLSFQNEAVIERIEDKLKVSKEEAEATLIDTLTFLWGTQNGGPDHPTDRQDAGWHEFLMFTRDYSDFCRMYFGRFIHHRPMTRADRCKKSCGNCYSCHSA